MGADNVELLDKRTADIIIHGNDADLIAVVESRTRPNADPPVWREYWEGVCESFHVFPHGTSIEERFKRIRDGKKDVPAIKQDLIRDLCTSDWLYLDYFACTAEVFRGVEPPGSTTWEDFIAPMFACGAPKPAVHRDEDGSILWVETFGRYLLTSANTEAMILSLRNHADEVQIHATLPKLERWHNFCIAHPDFCLVYQIDF